MISRYPPDAYWELNVAVLAGPKVLVPGAVTQCYRGLLVGLLSPQPENMLESTAHLLNILAERAVGEGIVVLHHLLMVPGDDVLLLLLRLVAIENDLFHDAVVQHPVAQAPERLKRL